MQQTRISTTPPRCSGCAARAIKRLIPGRAAREALEQYLPERETLISARVQRGREPERKALFLNGQGGRLSARSVERSVQMPARGPASG